VPTLQKINKLQLMTMHKAAAHEHRTTYQ